MNSAQVNGIRVYGFSNRQELMKYIEIEKKGLIAVNAEKILHANEQTRSLINQNIGYADGIGAVWSLKRNGVKSAIKIPGCELWLDIIKHYYETKSFYLVGSKEDVIRQTIEKLKEEFPNINILGFRNGYIDTDEEREQLIQNIVSEKPDIVFIAMGSPKQELLIQEMQQYHKAIYQGLGGSFDVYVGKVKRAPSFWINLGLEWAYRWMKEPGVRTKRNLRLFNFLFKLYTNQF